MDDCGSVYRKRRARARALSGSPSPTGVEWEWPDHVGGQGPQPYPFPVGEGWCWYSEGRGAMDGAKVHEGGGQGLARGGTGESRSWKGGNPKTPAGRQSEGRLGLALARIPGSRFEGR